MKTAIIVLALLLGAPAFADTPSSIRIEREQLGSGTPAPTVTTGLENAKIVNDSMYHAPQYMPGFPTAATIWPRTIEVPCVKAPDGVLNCEGYHWLPEYGRAEYLFVIPRIVTPPKPIIIERKVLTEVPIKKKSE